MRSTERLFKSLHAVDQYTVLKATWIRIEADQG